MYKRQSFAVRSGEILGIAGVEGNGQRELVELISGLRQMEKGDIVFDGTNIKHESILQLRNRHMAHIPQDRLLYGGAEKSLSLIHILPDYKGMLSMFAGALTSTLSGLAVAMQAYVDKQEEPAA